MALSWPTRPTKSLWLPFKKKKTASVAWSLPTKNKKQSYGYGIEAAKVQGGDKLSPGTVVFNRSVWTDIVWDAVVGFNLNDEQINKLKKKWRPSTGTKRRILSEVANIDHGEILISTFWTWSLAKDCSRCLDLMPKSAAQEVPRKSAMPLSMTVHCVQLH